MNTAMGATIINRKQKIIEFRVFALNKDQVSIILKLEDRKKEIPLLNPQPHLFSRVIEIPAEFKDLNLSSVNFNSLNLRYKFKLDGETYPDPYSNYQPEGVHGFSQVIDHNQYQWQDHNWQGKELENFIIMEIHVGTFTETGTFRSLQNRLDYFKKLGVNTLELMPVTQTPGKWNWGYDGTSLFSVNHNYGTPDDLKQLVDNCHRREIAVILDVVYNHFGLEGNYLSEFGPYLTDKHQTPWGPAVNYDDNYCEYTRRMVLDNVHYWLENFRFDGLRLDAVQTIIDESSPHILQEIATATDNIARSRNRKIYTIAETDQNQVKIINPPDEEGYGIDAQWMDDFHHCIHTLLTEEQDEYYIDYGRPKDLEKVYTNYLYTGEYSRFWEAKRGTDASSNPGRQFVVAIQNHDQVGNRAQGERLSALIDFPYLKVAAGLMFFSAYVPLLFMGEEYGETRPFLFFTDYQDPELQKKVTAGRKEEFDNFSGEDIPDPQKETTFYQSRLTPTSEWQDKNHQLFRFYRDLIKLRTTHPVLKTLDKKKLEVTVKQSRQLIKITRWQQPYKLIGLFNVGDKTVDISAYPQKQIFTSSRKSYGGTGKNQKKLNGGQMIILETKTK
ncbi:MAG: malto-oligosyltrehalose trehalohydrolase [Halanaerobiaceae bacterium]